MSIKIFSFSGLGDIKGTNGKNSTIDDPTGGKSIGGGKTIVSDVSFNNAANLKVDISDKSSTVESKVSDVASFSTLFNNFNFKVTPVYNFYTEDEEVNNNGYEKKSNLSELPRYIELSWNKAPTTNLVPSRNKKQPSDKKNRFNLQTKSAKKDLASFSIYKNSSINSYLSPGSINAVVELPNNKYTQENNETPIVDEELFLSSKDTRGLSANDLQTNFNSHLNYSLNTNSIMNSSKLKSLEENKEDFFDGNFSLMKDKNTVIKSVDNASPNLSVNITTVQGTKQETKQLEIEKFKNLSSNVSKKEKNTKLNFTEVNFIDPAIDGLIAESKVNLMSAPEHAENMAGLAQNITNLKALSDLKYGLTTKTSIPSFPASREDEGTEYIGYVIEKYIQDDSGVFLFDEEIEINDENVTKYIDTKILYGKIYRYRIRCLLKWTRKSNILLDGFDKNNLFQNLITKTNLSSHKTSYFLSEWCRNWEYASVLDTIPPPCPDEFSVIPQSNKKRILITFKLPLNVQKDIHYFRVFKKLKNEKHEDITDWELMEIKFGANNFICIDDDVDFFENNNTYYVYTSQTVTKHAEFSLLSEQLMVRLNSKSLFFGEYPTKQISESGVSFKALGVFATRPLKINNEEQIFKKNLMITSRLGTSKNPHNNNDYVISIKSLDTGEEKNISVNMTYVNTTPQLIEVFDDTSIDVEKLPKSNALINIVKNLHTKKQ